MKKFAMFVTAALMALSFNALAYTLSGTPTQIPQDAMQYCAGAQNFWVCVDTFERQNK
ncbi:hypothetical protein L6J37_08665 [Photobacterium sp. WH77]|uniref:Uncharacterized protein n=1 Tax=Photobacterium arenosum TaxID=2774143 RepID=A0ABR9BGZ5_9GAMM|nr:MULTISPECIES: hypothetical protein [Photobacterium]MBD8511824.1 hypothetical protein [Photobacterium arenosum]MBV7261472.1 hypothetical protein [Photobacterium sp. WH24]MCG2836899.1 hypothetical protein [Photobacterium sp. WH77]MCG2844492.1 hypothetical protein [Photobacterium sp. WH80]MDO6581701.1 hypothetical protein [Photobacterium sp. 2_MG-2023]